MKFIYNPIDLLKSLEDTLANDVPCCKIVNCDQLYCCRQAHGIG